jgi:hypothetical protein
VTELLRFGDNSERVVRDIDDFDLVKPLILREAGLNSGCRTNFTTMVWDYWYFRWGLRIPRVRITGGCQSMRSKEIHIGQVPWFVRRSRPCAAHSLSAWRSGFSNCRPIRLHQWIDGTPCGGLVLRRGAAWMTLPGDPVGHYPALRGGNIPVFRPNGTTNSGLFRNRCRSRRRYETKKPQRSQSIDNPSFRRHNRLMLDLYIRLKSTWLGATPFEPRRIQTATIIARCLGLKWSVGVRRPFVA